MRNKWLCASLHAHFSLWIHSMRTILMALFILLLAFMLARGRGQMNDYYEFDRVYLGETMFVYANSGFNLTMTSVGFLVMMSELPKRVSYQQYALMRLTRRRWLASLIVFCLSAALAFIVLLAAFSALFSLSMVSPGGGWSDVERMAADPDNAYAAKLVSEYIRAISPARAFLLAMTILYLFWATLALVILLFSLLGVPNFGVVFCVSMVMASTTFLFESIPEVSVLLPTRYATLAAVAGQVYERQFEHALRVILGYVVVDALLILAMAARVMHMDLRFIGKE